MMGVRGPVLLAIVASGLVTLIPRVLPLAVLSRITLPGWLVRWLRYVPVAVLAALLAQAVLVTNGHITAPPANLGPIAVVPTLAVAIRTRSLIGTVVVGVATMAVLRWFAG